MKLAVLFTIAALVLGGIYHTQIQDYFAHHNDGSSDSSGGSSYISSIKDMGNSGNSLMTGVGGSLNH